MRVLVIEDDIYAMEVLRIRLERLGCEVMQAQAPDEAVKIALEHRPGMVLADLNLGGSFEEGLQAIRRLRETPQTSTIPIVIHSIYVTHASEMTAAFPESDGHLPKPFKLQQLADLVTLHRNGGD